MAHVAHAVGRSLGRVARNHAFEIAGARKGRARRLHDFIVAEPVGGEIRYGALRELGVGRHKPGERIRLVVAVAKEVTDGFA